MKTSRPGKHDTEGGIGIWNRPSRQQLPALASIGKRVARNRRGHKSIGRRRGRVRGSIAEVKQQTRGLGSYRIPGWVLTALLLALGGLRAQTPSSNSPDLQRAQKAYAEKCSGCHGAQFQGTDQGPPLKGNRQLREMSTRRVQNIIKNGIPSSGMPGFDLVPEVFNALSSFVVSLNAPAAQNPVSGNVQAGERFFFGPGKCNSCHMVAGRGQPIGPDLSNIGNEETVDGITSALRDPDAGIAPGYQLVDVNLKSGTTLRGFARCRTNFDVCLEDLQGNLHLLEKDSVESIVDDPQSAMPAVQAPPTEFQNLLAYLSRLNGVKPGMLVTNPTPQTGGVNFQRILNPHPGDWLTYNGTLDANRYSPLTQVNTSNVSKLELQWMFTVPLWRNFLPDTAYVNENMKYFGLEVTPLVMDGVMYISGPRSVYALDALTGHEIWQYSRPATRGLVGDASLGTNRGVALLADKVFVLTDNAHLLALNRTTGKPVWEQNMVDEPQHYGATVAPLVVKNMVIGGVAGADWGVRGFLAAYNANTGERVWRFFTVPAKGEPGIETWQGPEPKEGGGSTWLTGSYDPETDTLYWPTATPYPTTNGSTRLGDNLYTDCILALDPNNGKLKWHYQFTPHDVHVWDATEPPLLVDARYRSEDRKLLMMANRNGFFYVLDRTNGKVLLAKPFIQRLTWASGIGENGRPQLLEEGNVSCPEAAANWNATAFSPATNMFYTVAVEKCVSNVAGTEEPPAKKFVRALDVETGQVVWEKAVPGNAEGKRDAGLLATAGGLLFYGTPRGDFEAMDERTGKTLWHFVTNGENKASPMTYTVAGRQYIAVAIGPNILSFALSGARPGR